MDKSRISAEIFNKRASAYQEKFMDVSAYSGALGDFCARIGDAESRILDIACGPGNVSHYLLHKRPEFKLLGIDLAPNMIALAREHNPGAEFREMDARDIGKLKGGFAGIACAFCLPYLSREEALQLIADAAQLLLPGGAFFLSTMEGDYADSDFFASSSYPEDKVFIHFHQADFLLEAMEQAGFVVASVTRQGYDDGEGATFSDLIIVAERGK